jgi:murein DD-endopeptidase MepM/ murein hydrolase activator NlpD
MIFSRALIATSLLAISLGGCGTSGFDLIKSRQQASTPIARPQPAPQAKPVRMASRKKIRKVEPEKMPTVATATPTATELPPPAAASNTVSNKIVSIPAGTVTVNQGETLYGVSRRTGVTIQDLARANNLVLPCTLTTGQTISVPAVRYYIVQPGETASKIARDRGVTLTQIAALNTLDDKYAVKLGQKLRLPLDMILPPTDEEVRTASASADKPVQTSKTGETPTAANAQVAEIAKPAPPVTALPMPVFGWPVEGKILSDFGAKPNGQFNDGVNIAVRTGQPVRAAADGEVVFASNQLKGFGNLLLIRHKNGWLSAYAHNDALLVKKGMQVQRGEVVARAGSTGSVQTAQLHFEVRYNRKPVNPMRILPERNLTLRAADAPQDGPLNPG